MCSLRNEGSLSIGQRFLESTCPPTAGHCQSAPLTTLRWDLIPLQMQAEFVWGPWSRQRATLQPWRSSTHAVAPSDVSSCLPSRGPRLPTPLGVLPCWASTRARRGPFPWGSVVCTPTFLRSRHLPELSPKSSTWGPFPGEIAGPLTHMCMHTHAHVCKATHVHTCIHAHLHACTCVHNYATFGDSHEGGRRSCGLWKEETDGCVLISLTSS